MGRYFFMWIFLFLFVGSGNLTAQQDDDTERYIRELLQRSTIDTLYAYSRIKDAELALQLSEEIECEELVLASKSQIGVIYLNINSYDHAHRHLKEALALAEKLGNKNEVAAHHYLLGNLYLYMENFFSAKKHYHKHLELKPLPADSTSYAFCLNSLGILYNKMGHQDSSKLYFEQAANIFRIQNNQFAISFPFNNLGHNLMEQGFNDSALFYFNTALANEIKFDNRKGQAIVLCNIGLVYSNKGNISKAKDYFIRSLDISLRYGYRKISYDCYKDISDMYQAIGNPDSAYSYYRKYADLKDSVLNSEVTSSIANFHTFYEVTKREHDIELKEQQIELLNQQKKTSKYKIWMLVVAILSLIVSAIFILFRQRMINRNKQELLRKNLEMQALKEKLATEKLKKQEQETKLAQDQLELKKQDLLNFGLDIARKNELNFILKEKLQEAIKNTPKEFQSSMKDILIFLQNNDRVNTDLALFQENIEKVNEEFFSRLVAKHPSLSKNEKHLCGMIKIGLSIKDIATVKNVSPASIEVARYRLRKKLNLEKGQELPEILRAI